jgi:hypothetical protein
MPKIFQYLGYVIRFYTNNHLPLTEKEARDISVFLKSYHKQIIQKWEEVFIYHKRVKFEVVSKRLKTK